MNIEGLWNGFVDPFRKPQVFRDLAAGRFKHSLTIRRATSTKNGSADSLNVSTRFG